MANPTWFDAKFYMASKLAQIQKADPAGNWDAAKLQDAFDAAGYTGVEGAYAHYDQFSLTEGTNPSQYVNQGVYLTAKLAQLQKADPTYTMDKLVDAFKAAGLTVGEHYEQFGLKEGINPSNDFDNVKYMADKLAQLQKDDPTGEWTAEKVEAAFAKEGLSPLDHFLLYGKNEGLTGKPVDDPIRPLNPGESFTLTDKADVFTGTAKDDTVTGTIANLGTGDTLVDANSTDYDVINLTADGAVTKNGATISGFEALNVDYTGVFASSVKADDFTGLKDLTVKATNANYTGNLTVTGAGTANIIAGEGVKGVLDVADVTTSTITANDAITAVKVAVADDADTGMTATINAGAKTATVDVTGAASKADTVTVNLKGDATVKLDADGFANNDKDVVTINAAADKAVTLDGASDTLVVKSSGAVTLKGVAASFEGNTVTNGTTGLTVEVTDAVAAVSDFSKVSAQTIVLDKGTDATATSLTFANGQAVTLKGAVNAATVLNTADAKGALNLTVTVDAGTLKAGANLTTLNIVADNDKDAVAITQLEAKQVTLSGDNKVTFDATTGEKFDTFNASALTGDLSMKVAAGLTTNTKVAVVAGQGDNTVTFDKALADISYTGGAKVDKVDFDTVSKGDAIQANLGAGDDVVTLKADTADATTKVFVDMGEGTKDTLNLTGDFSAANMIFTGVEAVVAGTDGATINATTLASLGSFTLDSTATNSLTVKAMTGETTIDASQVGGIVAKDWGALKLDGNTIATTITGSDYADTITTNVADATINGGKGADIITTGAASFLSHLSGGADADTFNVAATKVGASVTSGFTDKLVVIDDFAKGTGGDTIKMLETHTKGEATKADYIGTVESMLSTLCKAETAATSWFTDGMDSYIVYNAGTADDTAADVIVKLAGVHDLASVAIETTGITAA